MTHERRHNEKRFRESQAIADVADRLEACLRGASKALVIGAVSSDQFLSAISKIKDRTDLLSEAVEALHRLVSP